MRVDTRTVSLSILLVVVAVLAYAALTTPERRTTGERIGDAVEQLDNGVDNAARELKDRTPAEKVRDSINDATDNNENR